MAGKNPNIIFDDCDFEKTLITTLLSSFNNQGEICLCGSRIFIQQGIYERFLSEFVQRTKKLVVGDPMNKDTFMGALVSPDHLNKVLSFVEVAKKEGAKVLTGGGKINYSKEDPLFKGNFFEPTVIECEDVNCAIMQEEVFGPVVTVTPFESEEQALQYANSTKYGLSASVWTQDINRAHRVAEKIHAGTVWVNSWMVRDLRVPFGGMKASGVGREGGEFSVDFYTEAKNVCVVYS